MRFALLAVIAAALAPSVAAQPLQTAGRGGSLAGACGQPQALTYSLPQALDGTPMAPLSVELERAEPIYLEFVLEAETRLALRTEAADGSDPYLALFAAGGQVLAEDDDTAGGYNALIDQTLQPGTYCVQLRLYSGATDARARIALSAATGDAAAELAVLPPSGEVDAATLCTDPALVAPLDTALMPGFGRFDLNAAVDAGSRRDWQFSVDVATALQADTTQSTFDTVLTLTDAFGNIVGSNDDGPSGTDSRVAVELQPGDYCLSVSGYDGGGGETTLVLKDTPDAPIVGDASTGCSNPEITAAFGTVLAPGLGRAAIAGTLIPGSRRDWTLEVTAAGTYQFDLGSAEFDTVLTLLDGSGMTIEMNDDRADSIDSRIVATLEPGSYCLLVEGLGGSGGAFDLSASDRIDAQGDQTFGTAACTAPEMTAELGVDPSPGFGSHRLDAEIPRNGRQDWTFSTAGATSLKIEARSDEFDTILTLYDASGGMLVQNDDAEGTTNSALSYAIGPGEYCLTLEGFAGEGGRAEVALSELGAASENATAELGEVIPAPDSGIAIEEMGVLQDMLQSNAASEDATKWMAFSTEAAGDVTVNAVSASGGFTLRLFAEDGTRLGAAESVAGLAPATLTLALQPGRYLVAMTLPPESTSKLRNVMITRP